MVHCQLATKSSGKVVTWQSSHLARWIPGNVVTWHSVNWQSVAWQLVTWQIDTCQIAAGKVIHGNLTTIYNILRKLFLIYTIPLQGQI